MNVKELSPEQLEELRFNLYYDLDDDFYEYEEDLIENISDITDEMLFEHYDHISFVNDDFACSMDNEN